MFGEYGVYVDGKMIGSVCDDQLFVKPTVSVRVHAELVSDAAPNPSAKPQMLIAVDRWDDVEWLGELLRVTAAELPKSMPRKPKQARNHLRRNRPTSGHSRSPFFLQLRLIVHLCPRPNGSRRLQLPERRELSLGDL